MIRTATTILAIYLTLSLKLTAGSLVTFENTDVEFHLAWRSGYQTFSIEESRKEFRETGSTVITKSSLGIRTGKGSRLLSVSGSGSQIFRHYVSYLSHVGETGEYRAYIYQKGQPGFSGGSSVTSAWIDVISTPQRWWASYPKIIYVSRDSSTGQIINEATYTLISSPWLGDLEIDAGIDINWLYSHEINDWIYTTSTSDQNVHLFLMTRNEWIWTNTIYFPWIWISASAEWELLEI